jgi:serine/threonine protein kinase
MRQIVSAVKFIHSKNIIHRDLKLDNIMVSFNNDYDKANCNMLKSTIKIIDFGFAIQLTPNHLATTVLGSPINMDPLILKEMANRGKKITKLGYDQKADIWSLGTICYELLIGQYVFSAETMNELLKKVETGNYSVPTSVSYEVVSFLNGMLQYKGEKRLSADELSKHPFLIKNVKDFESIETRRVSQKINENGLNINVKKNQTIWSIFNENVEKKLLNINVRNQNVAQVQQMPQYSFDSYKRTNTDLNIPRINKNNNMINPPPNKNYYKTSSTDYGNFQSYTKHVMNPVPNPQYSPNYKQEPSPPFVSFNSAPISTQKTSYSSGTGGYNKSDYPTFDPAPYTFASEIYCPNPDQSQGVGFEFDSNPQVTAHFGTGSINEEPINPNNEDVCSIQ